MSALEVTKTMDTTDDAKKCLDEDNVIEIFIVIFIHVNEEVIWRECGRVSAQLYCPYNSCADPLLAELHSVIAKPCLSAHALLPWSIVSGFNLGSNFEIKN